VVKVTGKQQQWYEFKSNECRDLKEERLSWKITPTIHTSEIVVRLGSHMLEICPSIADGKPSCEGTSFRNRRGKEDPARLVFNLQLKQSMCH
jgi:hypothetical protein